jgi:hypothetical protein
MRAGWQSWFFLTLVGLGLTPVEAVRAQSRDGHGIRLGDFVLHSSLGSDVGYVTNFFASDNPEGSAALRVMPKLELKSAASEEAETPPVVAIKAGVGGAFQTYFDTPAQDSVGATLGLALTLNPDRPVGFVVEEKYQRTATPFTESGIAPGTANATAPDYARNQNTLSGHLLLQTKGGLLEGKLGYKLGLDWFDGSQFASNDSLTHTLELRSSWEFLPMTALFYEASLAMMRYDDPTSSVVVDLANSNTASTRVGINGGLTSTIGGTVAVGYVAGFYDNDQDVEGLTLNLEGRYVPNESVQFALGYDRTISQSFQGGSVGSHRVYVRNRLTLAEKFDIGAKAGVEFLKFGADAKQAGSVRRDTRIFADLGTEYRFLSWLAVTSQLGFLTDITDFKYTLPTSATTTASDDASFTAFEAWLGIRAFY